MKRLGVLVFLLVAACGTPPRERFYMLAAAEPPAAPEAPYSIAVAPVGVPEMVDRPQLVVRINANEVAIVEQARWAEPLRVAIAQAVAANLAAALSARALARRVPDADYRVAIDVQRFESTPGDSVLIDALWTVTGPNAARRTSRSLAKEKVTGRDYDALVAAHSAALAAISRDIAAAIRDTPK